MFDGTIVMAGAVSNGAAIRAAEILGADLAYLGTRFIATREAAAPDAYKAMLVEGGVTDVIYTDGVNGLPASWLKASMRIDRPRSRQSAHARGPRHRSSARGQDAVARHLERRPGHRPDRRHADRRRTRPPAAGGICRRLRDARHGAAARAALRKRKPPMRERITRDDAGGLCTLTLDRPEKLNALDTPPSRSSTRISPRWSRRPTGSAASCCAARDAASAPAPTSNAMGKRAGRRPRSSPA